MGIFDKWLGQPAMPKTRAMAIFRRIETGVNDAAQHEPSIATLRLSDTDMINFEAAGGRTSPHFPKKLKGIPIEQGGTSVLILSDGSWVAL